MENLVDYLRLDEPTEIETRELGEMNQSARAFILNYTGLTLDEADRHEDLTSALFLVVSGLFENRNMTVEQKSNHMNAALQQILGMHSVNLL